MIYQVHESHGKHIAYNTLEATSNNANGWKTVTEAEFYAEYKKPPKSDDLSARYEAKFGKKPHHKMKPESIEEALNGDG